jgi:hypothetical protein
MPRYRPECYIWKRGVWSKTVDGVLHVYVIFTHQFEEAREMVLKHSGKAVVSGSVLSLMPDFFSGIAEIDADFRLPITDINPFAVMTHLGCPKRCPWCAVWKIHEFKELEDWTPNLIILDNNLLACSEKHFQDVIEKESKLPYIDVIHGFDAELFTKQKYRELQKLKLYDIKFAYDSARTDHFVHDAIKICSQHFKNKITVYSLINYFPIGETLERLEQITTWGASPFPTVWQPYVIDNTSYVSPGWTREDIEDILEYWFNFKLYKKKQRLSYAQFRDKKRSQLS